MRFSVDSVYRTKSIGLILEAPFHVYAQLKSLKGIQLLFTNTTGNQLNQLVPLKENAKGTPK